MFSMLFDENISHAVFYYLTKFHSQIAFTVKLPLRRMYYSRKGGAALRRWGDPDPLTNCGSSRGLPKYIKTKVLTTYVYLI